MTLASQGHWCEFANSLLMRVQRPLPGPYCAGEGLYGTLARGCWRKVLSEAELDEGSSLLDLGAGVGL